MADTGVVRSIVVRLACLSLLIGGLAGVMVVGPEAAPSGADTPQLITLPGATLDGVDCQTYPIPSGVSEVQVTAEGEAGVDGAAGTGIVTHGGGGGGSGSEITVDASVSSGQEIEAYRSGPGTPIPGGTAAYAYVLTAGSGCYTGPLIAVGAGGGGGGDGNNLGPGGTGGAAGYPSGSADNTGGYSSGEPGGGGGGATGNTGGAAGSEYVPHPDDAMPSTAGSDWQYGGSGGSGGQTDGIPPNGGRGGDGYAGGGGGGGGSGGSGAGGGGGGVDYSGATYVSSGPSPVNSSQDATVVVTPIGYTTTISSVTASPPTAQYLQAQDGQVSFTAETDLPAGANISFSATNGSDNVDLGTATTDSTGVATVQGVQPGMPWNYSLDATGAWTITASFDGESGGFPSQTGTGTLNVVPGAPSLQATPGDQSVTLNIGSEFGVSTGYNVYEGTTPGGEFWSPVNGSTPITPDGNDNASYTVTGLINGFSYYFTAVGVVPQGDSPPSDEAGATPQYATTTTLSVSPASPYAYGATQTFTATVSATPSGSTPTGTVTFYNGSSALGTTSLNGGSPDQAMYTDTPPPVGSESITATYNGDTADAGSTSSATDITTNAAPPGAPTGLTATRGSGTATLRWTAPTYQGGVGLEGYNVYLGTSSGGEGTTPVNSSLVTVTNYHLTGLTDGQSYYVEVAAVNSVGTSVKSGQITVSPLVLTGTSITVNPVPSPVMYISDTGDNSVYQVPVGTHMPVTFPELTQVGNRPFEPAGVAEDSAGDTFIADPTDNDVIEATPGGSTSTLGTGLGGPEAVAVDAAGDVYIADNDHDRIVEVPAGGGTQVTVASSIYATSLAVSPAGDLYAVDAVPGTGGPVYEIPAGQGTPEQIASSITDATAVAVDAAGDVFISTFASGGNPTAEVAELHPNGSLSTALSGLYSTAGVAVDAAGNLFVITLGEIFEYPAGGGTPTTVFYGCCGVNDIALGVPAAQVQYGSDVSLQATVESSPNAGAPSGTVTFWQGSTDLGQAAMTGTTPDTASIALPPLAVGTDSDIYATFAGSGSVQGSTSAAVSVDVSPNVPSAPQDVSAVGGNSQVTVSWQPPADDGGSPITGYRVLITNVSGVYPGQSTPWPGGTLAGTTDASTTSLNVFSNVTNTFRYYFEVQALNAEGYSVSSTEVSAIPRVPATVDVADNSATAVGGGTLTFTASAFIPGSSGIPTGTLDWALSGPGSPTCAESTLNSGGVATCSVPDAPAGTYSATASYNGDSNWGPSSGSDADVVLGKGSTNTDVTDNTSSVVDAGGSVVFTAAVAGGGIAPGGTVGWALTGPGSPTCTTSTVSMSGRATCTFTALDAGTYGATATYSGDGNYTGSSGSDSTAVVGVATPTLSVTDNSSTTTSRGVLVFTADVLGGGVTPTGTVSWSVSGMGSPTCSTGTLNTSAQATCTVFGATGSYSVEAQYGGDSNYSSASGSDTATVGKVLPQMTLTDDSDIITAGDSLGLTVSVSGTVGVPTGDVTISLSSSTNSTSVECGPESLNDYGQQTCAVPDVAAGTYQATASYVGDEYYQSQTAQDSFSVSGVPSVSILASPSREVYGQGETVTTTFDCSDGPFGPGLSRCADSNGVLADASGWGAGGLPTAGLGPHTYTVTATSFDGQTTTSTVDYTVVAVATPTMTIGVSQTLSSGGVPGQIVSGLVTFTVTVGGPSSSPAPSQAVTLTVVQRSSSRSCSATLLDGRQCAFVLAAGSYVVHASYPSEPYYDAATVTRSLTVGKAVPTVTFSHSQSGHTVTFSVNVTGPGPVPTSWSTVTTTGPGWRKSCFALLRMGSGQCRLTMPTGSYSVGASYWGNSNYRTATTTGSLTVS